MIKSAMTAAAAIWLVAGAASAANGPGAPKANPAPRYQKCKPPTRLVWAVTKVGGPLRWSCWAAPESDCRGGRVPQIPVYVAAKQGWTCKPCPKGDTVYTTKVEGIELGHCRKP